MQTRVKICMQIIVLLHDCRRDSLIIVSMVGFTSILAGFALFSILGHLAYSLGKAVPDVVVSGTMSCVHYFVKWCWLEIFA